MKYRITLTMNAVGHFMKIETKHEYINEETKDYLEEIFLTILNSCKKEDRKAFYHAFAKFANEDFDDAKEFIEKELRHEN